MEPRGNLAFRRLEIDVRAIIIVSPTAVSFRRPFPSNTHSIRFLENVMLRCLTIVALAVFAVPALADNNPQAAPVEPDDMQRIFNGKDLSG